MKKTLLAMLAAAALSSPAVEIELLTNGEGTTLDGWTNTGAHNRSLFGITVDDTAKSWFGSKRESGYTEGSAAKLSQTVTLARFGISEDEIQKSPTVTASVLVLAPAGSTSCKVTVYQRDADGTVIESGTHTVLDRAGETIDAAIGVTNSFALNPAARQLTYELCGLDSILWEGFYGPRFRNCSLSMDKSLNVTFVSNGTTLEGTEENPPRASRTGDYRFLGYFTEQTGGVQVYDDHYELVLDASSAAALPSDVTLYAHWAPPEGSIAKLVYRGQLDLLSGGPAVNDTAYTKTMHFRVYDGSEATTPLWKVDNLEVTVNADGSFVQAFGDEALAALLATGTVTHVGLAIGPSADMAVELKPRRELRPVAAVNRALTAEGAAPDIRIGNLATENAVVAADATVSSLEVAGTVTAPGAGKVEVSPLVLGADERTRLLRGGGVSVFSTETPTVLATVAPALRGQVLATVSSDGIALISSSASGARALRCPAVVQYCRAGEGVRAPTTDDGGLKVTFFPFMGK